MKKKLFLILLSFLVSSLMAQGNKRYLKVTYIATPLSQYSMPTQNSVMYRDYQSYKIALNKACRYYYTLYVDLQTQRSVYRIDSLVIGQKPKGHEHDSVLPGDSIAYVVKYSPQAFFRYEQVLRHHQFYSEGTLKDIEWEITDKTKTIYNLHCKKAVVKNKDFLMNAWFTTDIAVSTGPGIFLNLPGLVVRSEDFFWTTEIENITYIDSENLNFEKLIQTYKEDFDRNKKGNKIKEKQLLFSKISLYRTLKHYILTGSSPGINED